MKRLFNFTLRTQLIASFLVIIILVLFLSFGYIYTGIVEIENKRVEETAIRQFKQVEYNVSNLTHEIEKISSMVMTNEDIQDFANNRYKDQYELKVKGKKILDMMDKLFISYDYLNSIFVFKGNGEIIGSKGTQTYIETGKTGDYPFYQSALYEKARNNLSSLIWELGDENLYFANKNSNSNSVPFISVVKALKWYYGSSQTITLVININEQVLSSNYKHFSEFQNSSMYIVDKDGRMISNVYKSLIGKLGEKYKNVDAQKPNGSFMITHGDVKKQVVYYHLKKLDWTFFQEIPLSDYLGEILTLRNKVILIILVSLLSAFILSSLWMNRVTKPLKTISKAMSNMEMGQIGYEIENQSVNEFGVLIKRFNKMSKSIEELMNKNRQAEEQKRVYEIEALQSQINPHFLYNTLNLIKWMAIARKADNIAEAITFLGNMLLPVFRNKTPLSSISDEVSYVRNYLMLINLRYGDGIKTSFDIDESIQNNKILKFILQPIVENSIFHGFNNWYENNTITISGYEKGEEIEIVVCDNGSGMDNEKLNELRQSLLNNKVSESIQKSIGLNNINNRLKLHFGENYGIEIQSNLGAGTSVVVKIPKVS